MSNNIDDLLRDMDEVLNVSSPQKPKPQNKQPTHHQLDTHKSSSESPMKMVFFYLKNKKFKGFSDFKRKKMTLTLFLMK